MFDPTVSPSASEAPSPVVTAIVLNWNGQELIEPCLRALLAATRHLSSEILVVDNGSSDGSVGLIRERFDREVRLIELPENLGYGAGNNVAIRQAKGEFIALINTDTEVSPTWFDAILRPAQQDPAVGMVAGKTLCFDDRNRIDNTGHLIYPDGLNRGRGRLQVDHGQYDRETEALFPSGCAALYRREMLDRIGLFDERFFAYGDDTDIGLRGRLAGWECAFAPAAVAYHRYSASTGAYSPLKAFYVERNRVFIALKYLPVRMLLASPYHTLIRFSLQGYGALRGTGAAGQYVRERSKGSLLLVLLQAYGSAIRYLPEMLRKRIAFRRLRSLNGAKICALLQTHRIGAAEIALTD